LAYKTDPDHEKAQGHDEPVDQSALYVVDRGLIAT
jgi:hypothetical protein